MKFKLSQQPWHGCQYHVVEIESHWDPDEARVNWQGIDNWCDENFGPRGDVWNMTSARWYQNGGKFYFRNNRDLTMFLLRWQ